MRTVGIILSGGSGSRMKASVPKQFLKLRGESLIRHSVRSFLHSGLFTSLVIVSKAEYISKTMEELNEFLGHEDLIVSGGETRHESVLKGIEASVPGEEDVLVFHDAARPFVDKAELQELIQSAFQSGASTLADKIYETLVYSNEGRVDEILNRESAFVIKTPQALHSSLLKMLLAEELSEDPTDLCSWVRNIGVKSKIVLSSSKNIKITTPADLHLAEKLMEL